MSNGNSEDAQRTVNQYARTAIRSFFLCIFLLGAFYVLSSYTGEKYGHSARVVQRDRQPQQPYQPIVPNTPSNIGAARQELRDKEDRENERRAAEARRREANEEASRKALQKAETRAITALVEKCEAALSKMKKLTVQWESKYAPLLSNDRGRQIATDEKKTQAFMVATAEEFPDVQESIDWLSELQDAASPLREAEAKGTEFSTNFEYRNFFESFLKRVNKANTRLEHRRRAIEVLLATSSDFERSQFTLAQGIEKTKIEKASTLLEESTRVYQQKLQEAIEEQAELILQAEKERIAAETELRVQQEKMATTTANHQTLDLSKQEAVAKIEAQEKLLEKDFEIDKQEINRLLGGFLGVRKYQPSLDFTLQTPHMRIMNQPGLLSLGRLDSIGALDQTERGYGLLFLIGGETSYNRKKSGFPNYIPNGMANPTIEEKVKRASELLNKYRDLLIEKKLMTL